MDISPEIKKKTLEVFVTSAELPIYAIRHNVPPEVFGAFGSYFSRNPKDFREHLWDAITGQVEEHETDIGETDLTLLADKGFREPYEVLKKGLKESQSFFKRWYGKYSHKSIANTVWVPMVATNVSQLFAKELAYDQLAFFIEQSTRFVKFDANNVYRDPDVIEHSPSADAYIGALSFLSDAYKMLISDATHYYKEITPFDKWLKVQDEKTLTSEDIVKRRKYDREINGQALDVARFLLPQAIRTNIAWILDARSTEFDIAAWKGHPLKEISEAALLIEGGAGQIAPSLLKYTEKNLYYASKLKNYDWILLADPTETFEKGVSMLSYQADALDHVIANILKRNNMGGTFNQRYEEVKRLSFDEKIRVLRLITKGRGAHDEWVGIDEEFDLVKITAEIRSDIGAIRDWRRHQAWDRSEALYTLDNGYHKPFMVEDMGGDVVDLFEEAMEIVHKAERKIRNRFPFQAQYIIPMAANHSITMSGGLDQAQYILWTRSTPEGNFSYRQDAFNFAEELVKIHPWMLGYEKYPEGKNFMDVYKEAPLKNLLRLQTAETKFHQ